MYILKTVAAVLTDFLMVTLKYFLSRASLFLLCKTERLTNQLI